WVKQVLDGWEMAPLINARTGNPFTIFDSSNGLGGDTVFGRYQAPAGATVPLSGVTNVFSGAANTFNYLTVPELPGAAKYADPLVGSGELPTCDMITNGSGNQVSTGKNCRWPSNMTHRNAFRAPGWYNINFALR